MQEAILDFIIKVISLLATRSCFFTMHEMMGSCDEMVLMNAFDAYECNECICVRPKVFWPLVTFGR
jgi:hypothetical protein